MKNILVRSPNWIGDQILAYPFFYYLRKAHPHATIVSVCVNWVKDIQFKNCVNDVFVLPRPDRQTAWSRFQALNEAVSEFKSRYNAIEFDLGISLPNSFSAAWFLKRVGVKQRRGYSADARGFLLNDSLKWDSSSSIHRAQSYVNLLPEDSSPSRPVREFWGVASENEFDDPIAGELKEFPAQEEWGAQGVLEAPEGDYCIFAPGATADSRRWHLDRFIALMKKVRQHYQWKIVIVGGPHEAPLVSTICERAGFTEGKELLNYVAKGPVSSLWKVFRNARMTVCNESGLSHVASLCGSPVQIVCGAADPRRTKPTGPADVQVALNSVECWPCEKNTCAQTGSKWLQCLNGIQVETVWKEMQHVLS